MGRQAAFGGDTAGADHSGRPDPFALPVTLAMPRAGRAPGAATAASIDRNQVVLGGPSGTAVLPLRAFRGIAVRMTATAEGALSVVLELNHPDPMLRIPLRTADDPTDVAADWQAWSRALGLPMLLVEADGSVSRPFPPNGVAIAGTPKPRRMHSYFADRRPRFLARRKAGWHRDGECLALDEIIARD